MKKNNLNIIHQVVTNAKGNINQNKKREANFELLRIILMLMIIVLHFNIHGGVLTTVKGINYYIVYFLEYACLVAVNVFVLITGYYMISSKIKYKKILLLWLQVIFYSVIIFFISILFFENKFNKLDCIKSFFPIISNRYWFITGYFGLYLLIPFINKTIKNLELIEYKYLVLILFILLSVIKTIYPINRVYESTNGYSLIWMVFLYLLGGYIRIYKDSIDIKRYKLIILYICMILINVFIRKILLKLDFSLKQSYIDINMAYNSIFILIESVCIFILFKNISINNNLLEKIILTISPLTLGVYLIHDSSEIRYFLWCIIIKPYNYVKSPTIIIVYIVSVLLIFTICCIIEYLRQRIFKMIEYKFFKHKDLFVISDK